MVLNNKKIFFDFCQASFDEFPTNERERIVVVSYFGKSLYDVRGRKCSHFKPMSTHFGDPLQNNLPIIEGYYDESQSTVHLHLRGVLDVYQLVSTLSNVSTQLLEQGYLTTWAELKNGYARGLLFLFSISHIMVLCHPVSTFDLSYVQLFKALDAARSGYVEQLSNLLDSVKDLSSDWVTNCRPCSPRMLFRFDSCPKGVKDSKKLRHVLEDRIYAILTKAKLVPQITSTAKGLPQSSASTLFSVPANEEFVYIEMKQERPGNLVSRRLKNIVMNSFNPGLPIPDLDCISVEYQLKQPEEEATFDQFLAAHIRLAMTQGFEENGVRNLAPGSFTLPKIWQVIEVGQKVHSVLLEGETDLAEVLKLHLDIDLKFSEARCAKVLPMALAAYQENCPLHYTRDYHEGKLAQAMDVLAVHGRGVMVEQYATRLAAECLKFWQNGRQMCQVASLTGHPCTNAIHRTPDQPAGLDTRVGESNISLESMEHFSGARYCSACNCGRLQLMRMDPYTLRAANYEFYAMCEEQCVCGNLESVHFPVFQPSVKDFRAAQLWGEKIEALKPDQSTTQELSGPGSEGETATRLSAQLTSEQKITDQDVVVVAIPSSSAPGCSSAEKSLVRQPSTTEYLPGMLHTESPAGLLPQFSSWSLVCLGPSSLYSHNLGLQDQPGLIPASSYLLPWDVTVRLSNASTTSSVFFKPSWPEVTDQKLHSQARSRKNKTDQSELLVKIFVGVEYECPRGHRFMMSGVDKVLKTTTTGQVKDTGHKVTQGDMALFYPCPCRATKPLMSQLMRVHVVTPKAPVRVTLNPRVQPAPGAPIFIATTQQPLPLSQSAYWVLRLPFVYMGERGPFLPPQEGAPPMYGRLMAGCYGISEIPSESR